MEDKEGSQQHGAGSQHAEGNAPIAKHLVGPGAAAPPANAPPLTEEQRATLRKFWQEASAEASSITNVKEHLSGINLPIARIKKIMKADEEVRMISSEAPSLFAKACELFILELTLRAWIHSEQNQRRTLQRSDIAAAISKTDVLDFLVDVVPREELATDASPGASGHLSQFLQQQQQDPAS